MLKGEKMSQRQRNKISESLKGHKVAKETRIAIGIKSKGRHPIMEFKKGHPKLKKAFSFPKGKDNPAWKGGKSKVKGYWYISKPDHPSATKRGYIKQSRFIMEKHLNRRLEPKENIHHINGIKDDDRIENLEIMLHSKHNRFHAIKNGLGIKIINSKQKIC